MGCYVTKTYLRKMGCCKLAELFLRRQMGKGGEDKFIGPEGSGTLAHLEKFDTYKKLLAKHIAVLLPGGVEDKTSDGARGWIGTTEEYQFSEKDGTTTVRVLIGTSPEWRKMFDDGWPAALQALKKIAEREMVAS